MNEAAITAAKNNSGIEYSAYKYYRMADWSKAKKETSTSLAGVKQWVCAPADEGRICVTPDLYKKAKKGRRALKNTRVLCRAGVEGA
jgi:hypothetical protein